MTIIVPVCKTGGRNDCQNYGSNGLLNAFYKLYAKALTKRLNVDLGKTFKLHII